MFSVKAVEKAMETYSKANITRKLVFSYCFLMLIFIFFGIYTLYDIHTISGLTRTIYNHPLVVSNAALQSNVSITKIHRNMKDVVLFEDSGRIQLSIDKVNYEEQQVYLHLDIVKNSILGDQGKILENKARILFRNWKSIRDEVIHLVGSGERERAAEITIGKGADHVVKLEKEMIGLTNYARNKASSFMTAAEKTHSRLNVTSILFLLLALIVSFLIAVYTLMSTASAENELRESRQLLVNAIDYAPIGMVLAEPGGKFYKVNQAYCEITGYSEKELSRMTFQDVTLPDDYEATEDIIHRLIKGKSNKAQIEKRYIKKNGGIINVFISASLLKDGEGNPLYLFKQVQDITRRKIADEKLSASLVEKETLLKEIHHRVKNNMQMIQSIISLQADKIKSPKAKQPLIESINRIRVMGLVHENLYKTKDLSRLNLENYFNEFVGQINKAFDLANASIDLTVETDPLAIDIDTVIVCGLIVNELVTNSIKYAFSDSGSGKISVTLRKANSKEAELMVSDNGKGLPQDFDMDTTDSLGLRIVRILSEGQLDGSISMVQGSGLSYRIRFPLKIIGERS